MDMSEEVIKVVSQIILCKVKATEAPTAHCWPFWGVFKGNASWFLFSPRQRGARKMKKGLTFVKSPTFSFRFLSSKREGQMSCFLFHSQGSFSPRTSAEVGFSFPGLHFRLWDTWMPPFIIMSVSWTWSLCQHTNSIFMERNLPGAQGTDLKS